MLNVGLGWFQSANEIKFIMARQCKKMQFTSLPSMSSQNFVKEHFPSAHRYELTKPSEQSAVVCVDRAVNRSTCTSSKHARPRDQHAGQISNFDVLLNLFNWPGAIVIGHQAERDHAKCSCRAADFISQ